jgi:hypothetical protein
MLIVLWIRGYSRHDTIGYRFTSNIVSMIQSKSGTVLLTHTNITGNGFGWFYYSSKPFNNYWTFRLINRPDIHLVQLPNWLFIAVSLIVAALPWLRWRYSLRTLLIIITAVALVLGFRTSILSWLNNEERPAAPRGAPPPEHLADDQCAEWPEGPSSDSPSGCVLESCLDYDKPRNAGKFLDFPPPYRP